MEKTRKIQTIVRMSPETRELLRRAAEVSGRTQARIIEDGARRAAKIILAESDVRP